MGWDRLRETIAPSFLPLLEDMENGAHIHYWLAGGRGSAKSSFAALTMAEGIMQDAAQGTHSCGIVLRRYGNTLRESVFAQLIWAIDQLGEIENWQAAVSPMALTYRPTGQKILFRGLDDPMKIKSIKVSEGWFKYIWYEEASELEDMESIRSVNQSLLRGGEVFQVLYSYNPPKSSRHWINQTTAMPRPDTLVHHSTYLDVPREWLGEPFLAEAEHLKTVRPEAYAHEYLGEVTGTGSEVFCNVTLRPIPPEESARFDQIRNGIDWGYAADPFHFARCHYDRTRRRLYIFYEIHKVRLSNRAAAALLAPLVGRELITCDSAEPKSIDEMKGYGLRVRGARKGPDSVEYGIKWLQDLEEIIIDPALCPETAREFTRYELDRDRDGNFKAGFPDRENHSIDAVRYACEGDMTRGAVSFT